LRACNEKLAQIPANHELTCFLINSYDGPVRKYSCEYIYTYLSRVAEAREELAKSNIKLISFDDVVLEDIPKSLEEWKRMRVESGASKSDWKTLQLPRKYRMLCLLDMVFKKQKLRAGK